MSIAGFAGAQTVSKLGIKAGVNFSSLSESSNGQNASTSNLVGFHVGLFDDFSFGTISVQPGIFYTTKGGKDDESGSNTAGSTTYTYHYIDQINLNYIEVPINVFYNSGMRNGGKSFIGGGPYIGIATSGKYNSSSVTTTISGGSSFTNTSDASGAVTFGNGSGDVKSIDYGINILGGVQFQSGLILSAGYNIGLANLSNDTSTSTKNNGFNISIGFLLGRERTR